jgi:hypothetical protein
LVHSNELFDIATGFTSGEEAVGAIFDGKKGVTPAFLAPIKSPTKSRVFSKFSR